MNLYAFLNKETFRNYFSILQEQKERVKKQIPPEVFSRLPEVKKEVEIEYKRKAQNRTIRTYLFAGVGIAALFFTSGYINIIVVVLAVLITLYTVISMSLWKFSSGKRGKKFEAMINKKIAAATTSEEKLRVYAELEVKEEILKKVSQ